MNKVVHSHQVKNESGSVYVYQQDHGGDDAWGLVNILSLRDTDYAETYGIHGHEYFGSSVSVSGRHIAVGCPRCHGRNVRETSAGLVFLYRCALVNASSSQCLSWELLKELVPEPEGTAPPSFCASFLAPSSAQGDWTCHREMDNFGNSISVLGCCNQHGLLLTADARTGRPSAPGTPPWRCLLLVTCWACAEEVETLQAAAPARSSRRARLLARGHGPPSCCWAHMNLLSQRV